MKDITVFEGNELRQTPPNVKLASTRCEFKGTSGKGSAVQVPMDDSLLSKHLLFLGAIGTGKTNAIFQLVEQIQGSMSQDDVMVIFDTKGDFYNQFFRQGDIVISNDEKATGSDGPDFWNLFNEIKQGADAQEEIIELARSLFQDRREKTNQPFFPNAASDIFGALVTRFVRAGQKKDLDNAALRKFFDAATPDSIRQLLEAHKDLQAKASYIAKDAPGQTQGVFSELQQLVGDILVGNFSKQGSISIREAIRGKQGRTIFVEYDLGLGNTLGPIYRLLVDLAIKESLRRDQSAGNVWFIIDEFRLIPGLRHVDNGVNFGRSMGAKFIIGVQNIEQVFSSYGEEQARSILSGFSTLVAFKVNDFGTREFVKQTFGRNRKLDSYTSAVQTRGIIENVREANVVEDWDLINLTPGQAIIGMPGEDPFHFRFDLYNSKGK